MDFNDFKINSSDILFHSSLNAVLSEPIFEREFECVLFPKKALWIVIKVVLLSGIDGGHKKTSIISNFIFFLFRYGIY